MAENSKVAVRFYNPLNNKRGDSCIIDNFNDRFVNSIIDLSELTDITSFSDLLISLSGSDTPNRQSQYCFRRNCLCFSSEFSCCCSSLSLKPFSWNLESHSVE